MCQGQKLIKTIEDKIISEANSLNKKRKNYYKPGKVDKSYYDNLAVYGIRVMKNILIK